MIRLLSMLFVMSLTTIGGAGEASRNPLVFRSIRATIVDTFVQRFSDDNILETRITGTYLRDCSGRTRIERGRLILIQDPTTRTNIVIDRNANVAKRYVVQDEADGLSKGLPVLNPKRIELGERMINGILARGEEYKDDIPEGLIGNREAITHRTERWYSDELRLAIESKSSDSVTGEHRQEYRDIVKDISLDPSLFAVPEGMLMEDVSKSNPGFNPIISPAGGASPQP